MIGLAKERLSDREFPEPRRLDLLAAVLLSAAIILTAYGAYENTRWSGVEATLFAEASAKRTAAAAETTIGETELSYDAVTFGQFAFEFRNEDLSDEATRAEVRNLTEILVRDEFKPFLLEWLALAPQNNSDAPRTPFDLPGFENDNLAAAAELELEATEKLNEARDANQIVDGYVLATVFFASVLFFTGISSGLANIYARGIVLALASVALVAGLIWIFTLPFH